MLSVGGVMLRDWAISWQLGRVAASEEGAGGGGGGGHAVGPGCSAGVGATVFLFFFITLDSVGSSMASSGRLFLSFSGVS